VFEGPGNVKLMGTDATTEYAMAWIHAFPDARMTVHNTVVGDGWAVQEFTFEGMHEDTLSSPGGEIPATHKHLSGRGVQIMKVEGGKIADVRLYFDQVEILTQLGVMPAAVGATA
jgi:predicted ester cyclase